MSGFGDLKRALQSIPGFEQCPYRISVGQYLAFCFILKAAGAIVLVSFFSMVLVLCRTTGLSLFISGTVIAAEFLCQQLIPEVSWAALLKYLNLFAFFRPEAFFSDYRLFNLLSVPVGAFPLTLVFHGIVLSAGCFVTVSLGRRIRDRHFTLKLLKNRRRTEPSKSLFLLELQKILIIDKGLLYIGAGLLLAGVFFSNYQEYLSREEAQYRAYMYAFEGRIDEHMEARLNEERQRFQNIHNELSDLLTRQMESGDENDRLKYQSDILQEKLQMEAAFERAAGVIEGVSDRPEAHVVYDTGYQVLFRFFGPRQLVSEILILLVIASFLVQGYFTDQSSGMKQLIRSSRNGREKLNRKKLSIYGLLLIGVSAAVHLMEFVNIRNTYGLVRLQAPACSLEFFPAAAQAALWVYVVLFYLVRTAAIFVLLLVYLAINNRR